MWSDAETGYVSTFNSRHVNFLEFNYQEACWRSNNTSSQDLYETWLVITLSTYNTSVFNSSFLDTRAEVVQKEEHEVDGALNLNPKPEEHLP